MGITDYRRTVQVRVGPGVGSDPGAARWLPIRDRGRMRPEAGVPGMAGLRQTLRT